MLDKFSFTQKIIELLPDNSGLTAEEVYPLWWKNIREDGGWRLTTLGYQVMSEHLKIEKYFYSFPELYIVTPHLLLKLDRKLKNPYYVLETKKIPTQIIFFGSKEAMLLNLYGNIEKFIDNYS